MEQWGKGCVCTASGGRVTLPSGPCSPRGVTSPLAGHEKSIQCLQASCLTEFALLQMENVFIALFFLIVKVTHSHL